MLQFDNPEGVDKVALGAPAYYVIQDAYGFAPFDESVLDRASPDVIAQTDRLLVVSYPLRLEPTGAVPPGCARPQLGAAATAPLALPDGAVLVTAAGSDPPPTVSVGRFSGMAVQPLAWPAGARSALLTLPDIGPDSPPWQVQVAGARSVRACPDA